MSGFYSSEHSIACVVCTQFGQKSTIV